VLEAALLGDFKKENSSPIIKIREPKTAPLRKLLTIKKALSWAGVNYFIFKIRAVKA